MKRLIIALCCVVVLQSCGLFKSTSRAKDKIRTETTTTGRTDSTASKVDKTVTTIKDKANTSVNTPEQTVVQDKPANLDSLVNGMTAIKNDLVDVQIILDPHTGVLSTKATIKPQKVKVQVDRETVIQNDIVENIKRVEQNQTDTKTSVNKTDVKKEPKNMGVWLAAVVAVALIVAGSIWFWLKRR